MAPAMFTASIVTYRPEPRLFGRALASLATAIVEARRRGALGDATVYVVDNGSREARGAIEPAMAAWPAQVAQDAAQVRIFEIVLEQTAGLHQLMTCIVVCG